MYIFYITSLLEKSAHKLNKFLIESGVSKPIISKQFGLYPQDVSNKVLCQKTNPKIEYRRQCTLGKLDFDMAADCIVSNIENTPWCWSEAYNGTLVDFYTSIDERVKVVFVIETLDKVLASIFANKKIEPHHLQEEIDKFAAFNKHALDFYNTHTDQCILLFKNSILTDIEYARITLSPWIKLKHENKINITPSSDIFFFDALATIIARDVTGHDQNLKKIMTMCGLTQAPEAMNPQALWNALVNEFEARDRQLEANQFAHEAALNAFRFENSMLKHAIFNLEKMSYQTQNKKNIAVLGAAERIKNSLSYRVGTILLSNSNSIHKILLLPTKLLQANKEYKNYINSEAYKEMPPLKQYTDIADAEKVKRHLTFKVGKAFVDNFKFSFKLFKLPFAISQAIKDYRKI